MLSSNRSCRRLAAVQSLVIPPSRALVELFVSDLDSAALVALVLKKSEESDGKNTENEDVS